jgi:regulation of enolase protein 1 (concanavalin A-like superfamily)
MLQNFIATEGGNGQITISDQEATITARARTDWFFRPDGSSRQANVPSLVLKTMAPEVSLAAKVSVGFAGTYDAGALFVDTGPDHWAKLAFELSPQGFPRCCQTNVNQSPFAPPPGYQAARRPRHSERAATRLAV